MTIEQLPQQNWSGASPEIMQSAMFAGKEMIVIQMSDDEPDLFELQYLGFVCPNIRGMGTAKSKAAPFAATSIENYGRDD